MGMIKSGAVDSVIAGGVETMSDVPLRLSRKLRTRLISMNLKKKNKSITQMLGHMKGIKLKDVIGIEVCKWATVLFINRVYNINPSSSFEIDKFYSNNVSLISLMFEF